MKCPNCGSVDVRFRMQTTDAGWWSPPGDLDIDCPGEIEWLGYGNCCACGEDFDGEPEGSEL